MFPKDPTLFHEIQTQFGLQHVHWACIVDDHPLTVWMQYNESGVVKRSEFVRPWRTISWKCDLPQSGAPSTTGKNKTMKLRDVGALLQTHALDVCLKDGEFVATGNNICCDTYFSGAPLQTTIAMHYFESPG